MTFYPFDKKLNLFTQQTPSYSLKSADSGLCFPHGMAFSPDGSYFVVTQFGDVQPNDWGIDLGVPIKADIAKVFIYKVIDSDEYGGN